jgi:hypothetical protein
VSLAVDSLRERLNSLGAVPPRRPSPAITPPRKLPKDFEPLPTPYGTAWRRADVLPLGRLEGRPPAVPHAYVDTETTGLAGGTGTLVFTAAVARPTSAGLEVVQLFLPEPAAEPSFLYALAVEMARAEAIGSYNGSTFDLPLLRTRWVMARMPGDLEHPGHIDLLHLARALLRQRMESCSLRSVEVALLGFEREEDLPGSLVPDAYFAYLRNGASRFLEAALEHNRQDVVSLYYLHARLLQRLAGEDPWMEAGDWLALGRYLIRTGRRADGWRALRNAVAMGQPQGTAAAALLLARHLVRRRRHAAAERLLAQVQAALPAEPALVITRARLLEWRLRDHAGGLRVVEEALESGVRGAARDDLERRRERLRRKLLREQGELLGGRVRRRERRQQLLLDCRAESGDEVGVERPLVVEGLDRHRR